MRCEVAVREARAADAAAREALVRRALAGFQTEAFIYFFLQELTLQCSVLSGAVLFIFCGMSVVWCCVLVPMSAVLIVAVSVWGSHMMLADKLVQNMRREMVGLVAEYRGPLVTETTGLRPHIRALYAPQDDDDTGEPVYTQIVGTVSVSEFWGPRNSGWMHALAVEPQWRRRGVGGALAAGARAHAARAGLLALEAALSHLQPAARRLLHAAGWEMRGTYQRPLLGAALGLPVAHLATDLPLA